jgi:hypothetical protein
VASVETSKVPEGTKKVMVEIFFPKLPEGVRSESVKLEFDVVKPMVESNTPSS